MNGKSMAKIGAISIMALIFIALFIVILLSIPGYALIDKQEYQLGESIKFNMENLGDYKLKITTPSTSLIRLGSNDVFIFKPQEAGNYSVELWRGGGEEDFYFSVISPGTNYTENETEQNNTEGNETSYEEDKPFGYNAIKIGENVNWSIEKDIQSTGRTKINVPDAAENIKVYRVTAAGKEEIEFEVRDPIIGEILDVINGAHEKEIILQASGKILVEYTTEGPKKQEISRDDRTKEIKISSPEGVHYENVLAYTEVEARSRHFIYVYWKEEKKFVDFKSYDLNEDGTVDRIEWIAPHLSEQTFEIIVISKAEHLDSARSFIADVYGNVSVKDNVWQEISEGEYLRITFEKNLTNGNDITLYARGSGRIEVYEKDASEKLIEFNISGERWYKDYFKESLFQDTFDLLVFGNVEFDYVVDPTLTNNPTDYIDSGSDWTGETEGFSDGGGYAEATAQNKYLIYYNYSFVIPTGSAINSVRVRVDQWASDGNDFFTVEVSWDGGGTWGSATSLTASSTELTSWVNVTSNTTWTVGKLNNTNFQVRLRTQSSGKPASYYRIDWAPVEVIYTEPISALSVSLNKPIDYWNSNSYNVYFNYTPSSTGTFRNCSLWDNSSGTFSARVYNSTAIINGTSNILNKTYSADGDYIWNIRCCDNANCTFSYFNRTLRIDTAYPIVTLVSPPDNNFSDSPYGIVFIYNVSDASVANCSLVIDGSFVQTDSTVSTSINQNFTYGLSSGLYNWSVNCSDYAGNQNASSSRTINVSVAEQDWGARWYETSDSTYTSMAEINLETSRDSTSNWVNATIASKSLYTMVSATSPFMGGQGALLEANSPVSFSGVFLAVGNKGHATWKVYISNSSGDTLICQSGDDNTGGTRILTTGSNVTYTGACTSPSYNLMLQNTDRIKLVLDIYNDLNSAETWIHYWDDQFLSYVDLGNFSTLGTLYTDLFAPATNLVINTGQQFNVSCEVNCSVGRCMDTRVYVQYNTSSSDWVNVSSSGNLILASGQTNGHSLGNVNTTKVWTNFTLQGNIASVDNIRCIGISDYSIDYGETTKVITVSAANQPPSIIPVTQNNYWRNESNIVLYYNVSDDNNLLANCSLYLNNQFNQTNSSALLNAQTNNFTISSIANGQYNWSVQCFDTAGLQNWSQNRTFYIDTVFPTINLFYPGVGQTELYSSTVSFNFTATDSVDSNLTCNLTVGQEVVDSNFNASSGIMTTRPIGGLGIGTHFWNVTCWDDAWNLNVSETRNFTIYDLPPTVSLVEPNSSYWHNESNIVLYYNASDNSKLLECSLILNNQINQTNSSMILNGGVNNFTIPFIPNGEYNWTVNCTDDNFINATTTQRKFYIDTAFPLINLNAPWNNNFSLTSSVYFNFTATDNMDTNLTCNLTIDSAVTGGSNFNASNGTLTNRLISGLTDGAKYWNVTCSDNAGNLNTSQTWMLNVTVYPSVALNTSDNSFFNYSNIYLNYTPSDNTNLSNCSLYLNGQFNQSNSSRILNGQMNNFSLYVGSGYYNWSVVCYDYIGLQNWSQNRTFTVDLAYPSINLFYPSPNQTIYDAVVYFNYTAIDDLDTAIECNLTVNNSVVNYTFAVNGSLTSIPVTFTKGGFKIWNVTCWDDAGNLNYSETRNFTIYLPPSVNLSRPDNNYWHNESSITLFYNITDYNADIANTTLFLNGQFNQTNSSAVSVSQENNFTIDWLADGAYNWTVRVADKENLVGITINRTFYIDTLAPNITLHQPTDSSTVDTNNVTFNFTVYDNLAPNLTCNLSLSGGVEFSDMVVISGQDTKRYKILSDGDYSWSVECKDYAGNYNLTEEWNFTVEAPPNVTLVSPAPDYRTNNSNITFVYLPIDYIGLTKCDLYKDGTLNDTDNNIEANENNQFMVYNIEDGYHNWTVNCTDSDANTFQPDPRFFTIDRTPPDVNLMFPLNNSGIDFNEGNITFVWNATDLLDSQLQCRLFIDGTQKGSIKEVTSGVPYTQDITGLTLNWHRWNVTCWDRAGNANTSFIWEFNFTYPDFFINLTYFTFNTTSPAEDDLVFINATIRNLGGADVDSFVVKFYDGDPDSGGVQINGNKILSILKYNTTETNVIWTADRGDSNIFVVIDPPIASGGLLDEWNESNNEANRSVIVGSWFVLYGNVTSESIYVLDDETSRVIRWFTNDSYNGSIFIADYESVISWADIQAIGKNKSGSDTSNDFTDIDALLGMTSFSDSVYNVFTDSGTIRDKASFLIFQKNVNEVPVANSTNNTNFITGILWDTSDDSDGQYSQADEEDLVFASKVNKGADGAYGAYDYEARVPAALREYKGTDSEAAFYIELY